MNILRKSLLIRSCSQNVNPLIAGKIDKKAERVLTEEYSQLDLLKFQVKNLAPLDTSALSGCSPVASSFVMREIWSFFEHSS